MANEIQVFNFNDAAEVRTVTEAGEVWFVASDVCRALEIQDTSNAVRPLDEDEKGTHKISTLGGAQQVSIISESGLYTLVLRSNKPQAKPFQKWVTKEVLPTIRKTGEFKVDSAKTDPDVKVFQIAEAALSFAKACGFEGNQALLSADMAATKMTGRSALALIGHTKLIAEARILIPSDIGIELGLGKNRGAWVNKALQAIGLQQSHRDSKGKLVWTPTAEGKQYGVWVDTAQKDHNGRPRQQLMWKESVMDIIKNSMENNNE